MYGFEVCGSSFSVKVVFDVTNPCHSVRIRYHPLKGFGFKGVRWVPGWNVRPESFLSSESGGYN